MSLLETLGLKKKAKFDWQSNRATRRQYKKQTGVMPPAKNMPVMVLDPATKLPVRRLKKLKADFVSRLRNNKKNAN